MKHRYVLLVLVFFGVAQVAGKLFAQTINNGELNGTVGVSATPTGWSQIPYTDPVSPATGTPQATSDVTNATGPFASFGIAAVPHSGTTCVTGLKLTNGGDTWAEGIMQTVSGFTPGNNYTITLYQAVVQQSNANDLTGAWAIYRDGTLLGTTATTSSSLAYNNVNVVWNQRTMNFQATAGSHTLKFLPVDDDANWVSPAGVRMGIDLISLSPAVVLPVSVELNAIRINTGARLSWEVRAEDQVQASILERSEDGEHFAEFYRQQLPATGLHETDDLNPHAGMSYYRLGYLLSDGETVYSEVKSIKSPIDIMVFVFNNVLTIESAGAGEGHEVELYSMAGANVFDGQVREKMDLNFLSPGMYVAHVKIVGQEGTIVRRKIRVD